MSSSLREPGGFAPQDLGNPRCWTTDVAYGDPFYWDAADPRPWRTYLDESDRRYEQYRRTQRP